MRLGERITDTVQKLGDVTGVVFDGDNIVICDTWMCPPRASLVLTDEEMQGLVTFYTDGRCPVCFEEILEGAVVCNECLERAQMNRWLNG